MPGGRSGIDGDLRAIQGRLETIDRELWTIERSLPALTGIDRENALRGDPRYTRFSLERQALTARQRRLESELDRLDGRRRIGPAAPVPALGTEG